MKWKDWDKNLRIRLFGEGTMNFLFWSYFPFMTIFFERSFGKDQAGLLLILSQAFSVIASLVGGYCADRFGRKKMMVIATSSQCLTFVLFAYANSPWYNSPILTFISFSLLGVWGALYWPASHAMVADVVVEKHRASVFAVFYTSINIAVVVGPIVGSFIFYTYRFEMLIAGFVLTGILTAVLQIYLKETTTPKQRIQEAKQSWYKAIWQELEDYRVIAQDKTFLLFIIAGVFVAQTFMQLDLLIAVYTSEVVDNQTLLKLGSFEITVNGEKAFALILAENGLLVALFTVYVTRVMNRFKERNVFIVSSLLYAIGIVLYGLTSSIFIFMISMVFFTFAELMVVGIQESFISKLAPADMRGQYFSAASLRFTVGKLLAPASLILTSYLSYATVFTILGGLALISGYLYFVTFRFYEKKVETPSV
ncbi:MFS transporter [Aquibacillus sp. 3ASR75-11]|uniref:MFS transporter n=1 Tax=Terrihalobacillus insolitus TaxID=2950438 RepID=A0A9X4AQ77_9BACI|nr:MFS transporter [Terrihalobacillus insolitus]MDC3415263.1 MFS transporter [Terrihalobacillus insolitus]MDC3426353.1 MFS transporter [Terrihalobacillus insolitus]